MAIYPPKSVGLSTRMRNFKSLFEATVVTIPRVESERQNRSMNGNFHINHPLRVT
jgi:hypothetical protein